MGGDMNPLSIHIYLNASSWEETTAQTEISVSGWAREREVWGPLLELLPPRPDPG